VRPSERIGNLDGALQGFIQPHPAPGDQSVKGFTGDTLHRYEVNAFSLADVVDGYDVGVVQRGSGLRFLHEALLTFEIGDRLRRQDFDGDKAVKVGITGLVDHTHPTLAKFLDDAVVRDGSPDKWTGLRHGGVILGWGHRQVNEAKRTCAHPFTGEVFW